MSKYTHSRNALGQSSGFQSYLQCVIEFLVGNRPLAMLGPHRHRPDIMASLDAILAQPSLYDETLLLLARQGFEIGPDAPGTGWREVRAESDQELAAWKAA